jgi:uncharacterized protein YijF (DUF1287 family)
MKLARASLPFAIIFSLTSCSFPAANSQTSPANIKQPHAAATKQARTVNPNDPPLKRVIDGSVEQTSYTFSYDPAYVKLAYPGGDVPIERGVCADVVIRAFRKAGVDLQKTIHEDMKRHFSAYPKNWGASRPDSNIDHRRVANLMTYFARQNKALAVSADPRQYRPGDVVAWELGNGRLHIGMVSDMKVEGEERYAAVHNISAGATLEDVLFAWKVIGHYRYFEEAKPTPSPSAPILRQRSRQSSRR